MKFFTLTLDTVLPGADYDDKFSGLAISTELEASHDCIVVPNPRNGPSHKLIKASIEVWNLSRFLVPERTPGTALIVLDFPYGDFEVRGGEKINEHLVRLCGGQNCSIDFRHERRPTLGFGTSFHDEDDSKPRDFNFHAAFTGCFLKVERNGQLMKPDQCFV